MVPGCRAGVRAELSVVLSSPLGYRSVSGHTGEKKIKGKISQISTTMFLMFCYLSLVGRHSLLKTYFYTGSMSFHLADDQFLKIIALKLMMRGGLLVGFFV